MDSNRQSQYDEAIQAAKQHLNEMERLLDDDSTNASSLEDSHNKQKPLLDQVLKSGHILIDELENGRFPTLFFFFLLPSLFLLLLFLDASDITQVEDTMGTLTERWLLIEELIEKKKSIPQSEDGNILSAVEDCEKNIDSVLKSEASFSSLEANNEIKLGQLKVRSDTKFSY